MVFAAPIKKGPISCTPHPKQLGPSGTPGVNLILCCQTTTDSEGIETTTCTACDDTEPPSNCTGPFNPRTSSPNGGPLNPPSLGTALPPSGNHTGTVTNGQTGLPSRLGNPIPPSNSTGKPPVNITLSPGSIFKVPPGTTNTQPTGNNTGTLPAMTVTKEHNPASPNIFSSVGNATNPNNNTSTLKLSPLEGQQHHYKGSNVAGNNQTNSIQGHSHVTIQNNG